MIRTAAPVSLLEVPVAAALLLPELEVASTGVIGGACRGRTLRRLARLQLDPLQSPAMRVGY